MNLNAVKRFTARALDVFGLNTLGHLVQRATLFPFIRAINYHEVPRDEADIFEAHLKFYSTRFVNVTRADLEAFLRDGTWRHDKPGIIISFDDALRSHFEVAAPLLEKYGFTGWFFVPSGWIVERNGVAGEIPDFVDSITLTHEQVRYLDQKHVVGCHTETHCRLEERLGPEKLKFETLQAKASLEELLSHPVDMFCWVGGEEFSYSKTASDFIRQGYEFGFMTNNDPLRPGTDPLQIQRTNIEAGNPLPLVRFQLSGLMDLAYYPKRKRVNELTK
jgi:peptidoglycan/xylan/chitin deacetylase (PgdA/CDA1 family)